MFYLAERLQYLTIGGVMSSQTLYNLEGDRDGVVTAALPLTLTLDCNQWSGILCLISLLFLFHKLSLLVLWYWKKKLCLSYISFFFYFINFHYWFFCDTNTLPLLYLFSLFICLFHYYTFIMLENVPLYLTSLFVFCLTDSSSLILYKNGQQVYLPAEWDW